MSPSQRVYVMNSQLKSLHEEFLVQPSNIMLEIVSQVIRVSVEDEASDTTSSYPAAVVTNG